jgi:hypothetical protein
MRGYDEIFRAQTLPVQRGTLCLPQRDDDRVIVTGKQMACESQEQEACPFSLIDSCHERAEGNEVGVRTWKLMKGRRRNGRATQTKEKKKKKNRKKKTK